jgi:DNA-directed RNA polymerase subunit RPC12/RpoP
LVYHGGVARPRQCGGWLPPEATLGFRRPRVERGGAMTTITTTCAGCGRTLAIPERYQGRELKCPDCGHPLLVPRPEATAPPAPGPEVQGGAPTAPDPAPTRPISFTSTPFEEPDAPLSGDAALPAAVYWQVKRVGVLSVAVVSAIIYGLLGLLVGLAVAVASFVAPVAPIPVLRGPFLGVAAVVVLPLVYAALGFVVGLLTATVYNAAARLVGGIKLLLE